MEGENNVGEGLFCLFSFPEKLTFHRYMVSSDTAYLQITHHGIVTVNTSNSHQHVSRYESPRCSSEEITLIHTHTHTHRGGLYTNTGQQYLRGHCVCKNNNVAFNLGMGEEFLMSVNAAQNTVTHNVTPCKHAPCNRDALPF